VEVLCSEDPASHTGPESCVARREVCGEALTGEHAGQPLSREISINQGADAFANVEGNTNRYESARTCSALRGRRTWHACTLLAWEPGDLPLDHGFIVARIGKVKSRSR
jgi:hypothetical protein